MLIDCTFQETWVAGVSCLVECEKRSLSGYSHNTSDALLNAKAVLRIAVMGKVDEFVADACQRRLDNWRNKALHGEFLKKVDNGGELGLSFTWMIRGHLKMPTEAQVIAAQDQALPVRAVLSRIYGLLVSVNCRVCGMAPE